ncbi:hypothetical protein SFRURICE_011849 [Spodoptera frugiperda]|nr:hypothetical protein SFRURICE_011849 [Spodoptera frugiperda]
MALEGVKSEKSEENNGNVPDGKANGIDNKNQISILYPLGNWKNKVSLHQIIMGKGLLDRNDDDFNEIIQETRNYGTKILYMTHNYLVGKVTRNRSLKNDT